MSFELYNQAESKDDGFENIVKLMQDLYIGLAEKHLPEESSLRKRIIEYYSDTSRLQEELSAVFKDVTQKEAAKRIQEVASKFEDQTFFIEHYQKIFERTDTFARNRQRAQENPIASQEEYDAGAYKEGLETQVSDAMFALRRNGYQTFESGFREDNTRDQYVGMYNKKVILPDSLRAQLKNKNFAITLIPHSDRTIINIHPLSSEPVSLEVWKAIWDEFSASMPKAEQEDLSVAQTYSYHNDFRQRQDVLKKLDK